MGEEGAVELWWTGPADDPRRYCVTGQDLARAQLGGEGLVYRATRNATAEVVALKFLTGLTVDDIDRVRRRAAAFDVVDHPNVMSHVEVFVGSALTPDDAVAEPEEFDIVATVAEWIEGTDLTDARKQASTADVMRWIVDLAQGLQHLHTIRSPGAPLGIVHRDVKPSNVRIADDGRAVLVDFGVARPVDHSDMTVGVGTYRWRAPEVLAGADETPGVASDVWGLGAVAHWMLTGDPPALDGAGAARERLRRALSQQRHGATIARHLSELLHSEPGKRPTDLARWATRLERLADTSTDPRRRARLVALGAGCAIGLVAFLPPTSPPVGSRATPTSSVVTSTTTTAPGSVAGAGTTTSSVPDADANAVGASTTTVPLPLEDPRPVDNRACVVFQLNVRALYVLLGNTLAAFRTLPAAEAFGDGAADTAIGDALNSITVAVAEVDGLRPQVDRLGWADRTLVRGLIITWLATAQDGRRIDRDQLSQTIARMSPLVEAAASEPSTQAPLEERLEALATIVATFEDGGCRSDLWKTPDLKDPRTNWVLQLPAATLGEFLALVDQLRYQLTS